MVRAITVWYALTGLLLGATAVNGQETQSWFTQALQNGSFGLVFRYRYELADQDGIAAGADASTLRTRLTYNSAAFWNLSLLLEMDDVRPVGADSFNSTRNGKTTRPVVADPKGTELNQAGIRFTGFTDTEIDLPLGPIPPKLRESEVIVSS